MTYDIRVSEVRSFVNRGLSLEDACEIVGIPTSSASPGPAIEWIPTPSEIVERSAEVQRHWTAAEKERRRVAMVDAWVPPCYRDAG